MTSNKFTKGKGSTKTPPVCKKPPELPWQCPIGLPLIVKCEAHAIMRFTGDDFDTILAELFLERISPSSWFDQANVPAISPTVITTCDVQVELEWFTPSCKSRITMLVILHLPGNPQDGMQQNFIYKGGNPFYYDTGFQSGGFPSDHFQAITHVL